MDAVALLLSVSAGAWAFGHRDASERRRRWWLLFAVAAFAAKQSALGAALGICLYALLRGRAKEAVAHGLFFSVGCFAVLGLSAWLTDGQSWQHAIVYNAGHERRSPLGADHLRFALEAWRVALPFAFLALVAALRPRRDLPWLCWLAGALPSAWWMSSKSGSHVHYFQESALVVAILCGLALPRALAWARSRSAGALALAAGLGLFALLHSGIAERFDRSGVPGGVARGAHFDYQVVKRRLREVRERDPVPAVVRARLDGDPRPPLLLGMLGTHAIESGRAAYFDMADMVRLVQRGVLVVERDVTPAIAERRFSVIGLPRWPQRSAEDVPVVFRLESLPGLVAAVETHYEELARTREARWFRPKNP